MAHRQDHGREHGRHRVRKRLVAGAAALTLLAGLPLSAAAQIVPIPQPVAEAQPDGPRFDDLAPAVRRLLASELYTEEDLKDLRIEHGVWRESDLDTPRRVARAMLTAGAVDDPTLRMEDIDPLLRARAALVRGDAEEVLRLTEDAGDADALQAASLRAEALSLRGDYRGAVQQAERALSGFNAAAAVDPDEVVGAARLLALRARLLGPEGQGGSDFHAIMSLLGSVRARLDRLNEPSLLAEAELLYEKDNAQQAHAALQEALGLNPSSARALAMLGRMAVDAFDFTTSERFATRLDRLAEPGVSPYAGLIRARAALRQREPELALESLEPLLQAYPQHREALALQAAAHAVRYDFDGARSLLERLDELSPGSALGAYEVGRALAEARQYEEAAAFLQDARERLPAWPAPLIELGLVELQAGRDEPALEALRRARELDPFNVRADNSLRLAEELQTYRTVESEHFIVRYKPGADDALARDMLGPLEEMHRIVTGSQPGGIDHEPEQRTQIELMPDSQWFAVRITGMPDIHTIAASTGPVIAMESPREGARHKGPYDWLRVVRHEYVHTVTLSRTLNRIPHWFTEAAAVYLELSPRDESTVALLARAYDTQTLFDLDEINVAFVRPKRPSDRSQAYAQGHWMYEFIIDRWGPRAPLDLMDLYAQGVSEASAFETVLGVTKDGFLDEFRPWARRQLLEWGMELPPGMPSFKELLVREAASGEGAEDAVRKLETLAEAAAGAGVGAAVDDGADAWDLKLPSPTRQMATRWLQAWPDHPDVLQLAIELDLEKAGGTPTREMIPMLERYAEARPVAALPHRLLASLYLAGEESERALAIEHLEWLDARAQYTPTYAIELAKRYAALDRWDQAAEKAERAASVDPYDADHRELAATAALKRGDLESARRHILALTEIEPQRETHRKRLEAVERLLGG